MTSWCIQLKHVGRSDFVYSHDVAAASELVNLETIQPSVKDDLRRALEALCKHLSQMLDGVATPDELPVDFETRLGPYLLALHDLLKQFPVAEAFQSGSWKCGVCMCAKLYVCVHHHECVMHAGKA